MNNKPDFLLSYAKDVTSQHGEDGMIEHIFEVIGEESKWCVELGALNGKHDSNVWRLLKEKGWSGVLIEADPTYYEKLVAEYSDVPSATCIKAFVSFEGETSLDALFATTKMPTTFDLLSLDIDGNEYHLWDSLVKYTPRVVVIEFNPSIPNDVSFIQPRDMSVFQGASARAFVELAKERGYELVGSNVTNAFFVRKELFPLFDMEENSLASVRTDHRYETMLYQLYDGTLKTSGNQDLIWHKRPIDEERLQVLPRYKRR